MEIVYFLKSELKLNSVTWHRSFHLDGVVGPVGEQQRLAMQEGGCGDGCAVGVSLLSDQLAALQVPECNVALWTARRHDGWTVWGRARQIQGLRFHRSERERWQRVRDYHPYLFGRRARWLVPSPVWSSSASRPIGCCEWWHVLLLCRCPPRPRRDSGE